jgi:hypothetical protein
VLKAESRLRERSGGRAAHAAQRSEAQRATRSEAVSALVGEYDNARPHRRKSPTGSLGCLTEARNPDGVIIVWVTTTLALGLAYERGHNWGSASSGTFSNAKPLLFGVCTTILSEFGGAFR